MRVNDLLKWKRALNEIKFKHIELDLVQELCDSHGPDFQMFMEEYCEKNNIDLLKLNRDKALKESLEEKETIDEDHRIGESDEQGEQMVVSENHYTEHAPPVDPIFAEEKDIDEIAAVFKTLFKKLAMFLHPDRSVGLTNAEKEDRLSMFKEAKQALADKRYFVLLEMSEKFKIRMPKNYKQQTRWMKAKTKQLDQEIQAQKHTYNYVYAECETTEEKERIVKNFLKQIFQI